MYNRCRKCGSFSTEKTVGDRFVECPICGYKEPFKKLPLFCLTGASGIGKTTAGLELAACYDNVITLEGDMVWIPEIDNTPETDYRKFRERILRMAKNVAQGGKPTLITGCTVPGQYEICDERKFIGNIYYIAVVCEEDILAQRLFNRDHCSQEFIDSQKQFNHWFGENYDKYEPNIILVDNTHCEITETAKKIMEIIDQLLITEGIL